MGARLAIFVAGAVTALLPRTCVGAYTSWSWARAVQLSEGAAADAAASPTGRALAGRALAGRALAGRALAALTNATTYRSLCEAEIVVEVAVEGGYSSLLWDVPHAARVLRADLATLVRTVGPTRAPSHR